VRKHEREVIEWAKANNAPRHPRRNSIYGGASWFQECGGKIAHRGFDDAKKAFDEIKDKPCNHNHGHHLAIYICGWCEYFHIGHQRDPMPDTVYCEAQEASQIAFRKKRTDGQSRL